MKEKIKAKINMWTRPTRKWTDIFIIAVALSVGIIIGGEYLIYYIFKVIPFEKVFSPVATSYSMLDFLFSYVVVTGSWLIVLPLCGIYKPNRPILKQLAPNKNGNNLKGILAGLLLGFGTNGFCVLMSVMMGKIHLSYNKFDPALFFIFVVFVTLQSGAEELVLRVYLYQKLRRRYKNPLVAIIVNPLVFTAMHLFNEGITVVSVLEIAASGILCTLLVYYYDSAWAAILMHASWNFTQNILFGLPNSGLVSEYSLFKPDTASAQNGLFFNVDFGVEGSVGSLIVQLVVIAVIIMINRGKPEKNDVWENIPKKEIKEV